MTLSLQGMYAACIREKELEEKEVPKRKGRSPRRASLVLSLFLQNAFGGMWRVRRNLSLSLIRISFRKLQRPTWKCVQLRTQKGMTAGSLTQPQGHSLQCFDCHRQSPER